MEMKPCCKEVWFIWGVMLVSFDLRLVCLGVILTIMVSCSLEAHVPSPTLVSSSHPPCFPSNCGVAGVTGIAYPSLFLGFWEIRNCFRFLCIKLRRLQHYCNYYSYIIKNEFYFLCSFYFCFFIFICIYFTNLKA